MGFGLLNMHPLFTSSFRIKILQLSIIIAIPALIVLVYVEAGLNRLDTHYLSKKINFESQLSEIEILSLGSSNAYFGINPQGFSCKGYNLAYNAQSMYYDLEFIQKYINSMPKLKVVILPAIFYTTGSRLVSTSQDWRIFFYNQYWGLPLENEPKNLTGNIKRHIDSRNYSKIALYSDTLYHHVRDGFSGNVDYVPEKNGWYNSKDAPKLVISNEVGRRGAESQSLSYSHEISKENIAYWQEIISILKKRSVQVILVHLPEEGSYYNFLDKNKSVEFTKNITELALKNNIKFADYSRDQRFDQSDYTFMPDHLNDKGALKFSEMFDKEYLNNMCK